MLVSGDGNSRKKSVGATSGAARKAKKVFRKVARSPGDTSPAAAVDLSQSPLFHRNPQRLEGQKGGAGAIFLFPDKISSSALGLANLHEEDDGTGGSNGAGGKSCLGDGTGANIFISRSNSSDSGSLSGNEEGRQEVGVNESFRALRGSGNSGGGGGAGGAVDSGYLDFDDHQTATASERLRLPTDTTGNATTRRRDSSRAQRESANGERASPAAARFTFFPGDGVQGAKGHGGGGGKKSAAVSTVAEYDI